MTNSNMDGIIHFYCRVPGCGLFYVPKEALHNSSEFRCRGGHLQTVHDIIDRLYVIQQAGARCFARAQSYTKEISYLKGRVTMYKNKLAKQEKR